MALQIPGLTARPMGADWLVAGHRNLDTTQYSLHEVTDRQQAPSSVGNATFVLVGPKERIIVPSFKPAVRIHTPLQTESIALTAAGTNGEVLLSALDTQTLDGAMLSLEDVLAEGASWIFADAVPEFLGAHGETLVSLELAAKRSTF